MSRNVSPAAEQAALAESSDEAFITLITIDHSDLSQPIRVCNDGQDLVSRGATFIAMAFHDEKPGDDETGVTAGRLAVQNVSQEIVLALRSITSKPSVLLEIVRASDPDTVEQSFDGLRISEASWDVLIVEAPVDSEDFLSEPYPKDSFTPALFPGMF